MKKLLAIVALTILLSVDVYAQKLLMSKCFTSKNSKSPELKEEKFNDEVFDFRYAQIDLTNNIVSIVTILSNKEKKKIYKDAFEKSKNYIKIGIRIQEVTDEIAKVVKLDKASGALVAFIKKDDPAYKAGIQLGDIILEIDNQIVNTYRDLPKIIAEKKSGQILKFKILRNKKVIFKDVVPKPFKSVTYKEFLNMNEEAKYPYIKNLKIIDKNKFEIKAVDFQANSKQNLKLTEAIINLEKKQIFMSHFSKDQRNHDNMVVWNCR